MYGLDTLKRLNDNANTRLIAAAPDMLAALSTVSAQLRIYGRVDDGGVIAEIVNEAIAKATGEKP